MVNSPTSPSLRGQSASASFIMGVMVGYFLRLARQRDKCQHNKYFLINPWQVYAAIVQSPSRRLKPAVMAPSILAVGPGSGGEGTQCAAAFLFWRQHTQKHRHTLAFRTWARINEPHHHPHPHPPSSPLSVPFRPSKMDEGAAWRLRPTLISAPMERRPLQLQLMKHT